MLQLTIPELIDAQAFVHEDRTDNQCHGRLTAWKSACCFLILGFVVAPFALVFWEAITGGMKVYPEMQDDGSIVIEFKAFDRGF